MNTIQIPAPDPDILCRREEIIAGLAECVDDKYVISAPSETVAYECDAFTAYRCPPLAVVLPRSTEEVSRILSFCHLHRVPVVPRGAGTSLAGGVLPTADSVIVSTARMRDVIEVSYHDRFIHVQSGTTNLAVTEQVKENGFFYAPDPSSQLACAISGNIAMNSGGAHCLKYGVTTNNLLAATVVLADGEVITLGGEYADAAPLDLLGVLCGSEGQLGIVTEAVLRILPRPEGARPLLLGFDDPVLAGQCVSNIIQSGLLPVAIEYMDRLCIDVVKKFTQADYPDCEAILIIEVEGAAHEIDAQINMISEIASGLKPVAIRTSQSAEDTELIWKGRKSAFGAMGQISDYICLDGTVPVSVLPQTLKRIGELSTQHGLRVANVFHAGDGNMHPLILYDANALGEQERAEALGAEILQACVDFGGCLTGEHGVGVEKRELMLHQFSPVDLEVQMRVKDVFDPLWLLNSCKVFPLDLSATRRGQG